MTEREKLTFQQWQKTRTRVTRESDQAVFEECDHLDGDAFEGVIVAYHVYQGGHFISEEMLPDGETLLLLNIERDCWACVCRILDKQAEEMERKLYDWVDGECPSALSTVCSCESEEEPCRDHPICQEGKTDVS